MQSFLQYRRLGQQLEAEFKLQDPSNYNSSSSDAIAIKNFPDLVQEKGINHQYGRQYGGDADDPFLVHFNGDEDSFNPKNWPTSRKWRAMSIIGSTGFIVTWSNSIDSGVAKQAANEFQVSDNVEALATGLFCIAFGIGALFAAPFSETIGRSPVYLVTLFLFMIFVMASGLAPNIAAQLAFRFLAGLFGTTPLTTFGGSMSDMFYAIDRTYVFPICACLSFLGPFLSPMIGAYIGQSGIDWRWVEWLTLIMAGVILVNVALFLPETYAPVLLQWKAQHLRRITGDNRYRAQSEQNKISLPHKLVISCTRPFKMFFTEIIVALFSLYMAILYIVLFGFLPGYEFLYGDIYHFSQGKTGLAFVAIDIGFLIALSIVPFIYINYNKKRIAQGKGLNDHLEPEQRLWYGMIGGPWLPISLFWMAWTANGNISVWSCLAASITFGFAVMGIFISSYTYIIDCYEQYAASALAVSTFIRYVAAGVMQVVALPMFKNLGVHWSLTLLACISLVLTPLPYLFYAFGERMRNTHKKGQPHVLN